MKIRFPAAAACFFALLFSVTAGFLGGLKSVFLDDTRYAAIMDRLNVYEDVGVSREEQLIVNRGLSDYLAGLRDDLYLAVTLDGRAVDTPFNERELKHLEDVKRLFQAGLRLRYVLAALALAALTAALLFSTKRERRRGVAAFLIALCAAAIVGAVVASGGVDFDAMFIAFHRLAFDNDLWLLNPATDALIRMLPEAFFEAMALDGLTAGVLRALCLSAVAALLMLLMPERKKRHDIRSNRP